MRAINKIIVPVDFLEYTGALVEFAVDMAKKLDVGLNFIHVVEPVHVYGDYAGTAVEDFESRMAETGEEKMRKLVEANRDTCSGCEGKIAKGDVVGSIVSYAKEQDGGMIILATHGKRALDEIWLGSIAERVVKRSPCPTLVFNPGK